MEEDGFTLVKRTKKGKNKVNIPKNSTPHPYSKLEAHSDLSKEEIQENISDSLFNMEQVIDFSKLRTLEEIRAAFDKLKCEEDRTEKDLESILASHKKIESELKELVQCGQYEMGKVENDALDMAKSISITASLADGVSAKVKQLDLAKSRVSDCQQRVNDLIDLRLCADGVKTALSDEDYEKAAAHLHRFLNMDEISLKTTASRMNEGNGQGLVSLDGALATLHDAEDRVRRVVSKRFDEAIAQDDLASIERFFKLFPLINMHDEGLQKFSIYMSNKIANTSLKNLQSAINTTTGDPRSSVVFADTLTLLFEGIARTVEIHQPLIETYYGPGRLTHVLTMLQKECDVQAHRIFVEFKKNRQIKDKVDRIRDSSYGTTSNVSSSASADTSVSAGNYKLEARELHHVLEEMTLLQARSEIYFKFIRKKAFNDIDSSSMAEDINKQDQLKDDKKAVLERHLITCGLSQSVQEILSQYILFEEFYMTQNIRKASEQHKDTGINDINDDKLLDDVFFIVKQCVTRAAGCGNLDGICAVANNACSILETEFASLLQSQLKMGFPSGYLDMTMNVIQNYSMSKFKSTATGAGAGSDSVERQKMIFLSALNCADNSKDYISRLTNALKNEVQPMLSGKSDHEKEILDNSLSGFPALAGRLQSILDQGMHLLRQAVIKPRIKPWVDSFPSHNIDEEVFADYEANDPFIQTLVMNLDGLLGSFKGSLTEKNFENLVTMMSEEVTLQIEKATVKSKFSRLGGLLFDKEVRALVSFFTSGTSWSIREKFFRLTQMATILNLESVEEIQDFQENWKFSSSEIKQILQLRVDFISEEIKRLRL